MELKVPKNLVMGVQVLRCDIDTLLEVVATASLLVRFPGSKTTKHDLLAVVHLTGHLSHRPNWQPKQPSYDNSREHRKIPCSTKEREATKPSDLADVLFQMKESCVHNVLHIYRGTIHIWDTLRVNVKQNRTFVVEVAGAHQRGTVHQRRPWRSNFTNPQDFPRALPSGNLLALGKSFGRRGWISQYLLSAVFWFNYQGTCI